MFFLISIPREKIIKIPTTKVMLRIFAPIIFPKLNAGFPEIAEEIPVKSSGKEVAMPIIKKEITNSEIFKTLVIFDRDFTKKTALITMKNADVKNSKRLFISIFIFKIFPHFKQ